MDLAHVQSEHDFRRIASFVVDLQTVFWTLC
jgi:hypothetical protein